MEAGIQVTLNSDDPPMFNTTLTKEYLTCTAACGWDKAVFRNLVTRGVSSALCGEEEREILAERVGSFFDGPRSDR